MRPPARTWRWFTAAGALALGASFLALRWPAASDGAATHSSLVGSGDDREAVQFVEQGRDATRRYRSQQEAINDGFTRVGGEFPAMGEHWVSFARVMDDTLDARRPSVLIYTRTLDGPQLAGVGYSRLVMGDRTVPAFPFEGAWHEHSGSVADESLPVGHGAHAASPAVQMQGTRDSPRFFILHAWVWTDNPDGPFATDNWALPLARLGIPTLPSTPRDAARAVGLVQDESDYHRTVIAASLALDAREDSAVSRTLGAARRRARGDVQDIRASGVLPRSHANRLAAEWDAMWRELARELPLRTDELTRLRARM